jgi:hypothetical protein
MITAHKGFDSFLEQVGGVHFIAAYGLEPFQVMGLQFLLQSGAQVIDTDDFTGFENTSVRPQIKAVLFPQAICRQIHIQQQVDQQKDRVVSELYPCTAAASSFFFVALPAYFGNSGFLHDLPRRVDTMFCKMKKSKYSLVLP